ncbi:3',5'-cyclic-nucleotide phosphodiesterase [Penicillium ochrochloron]
MGDRVECIGVYVDDRVRSERWVRRNSIDTSTSTLSSVSSLISPNEPDALQADVEQLLEVCKKVYLCHTGASFATKLAELSDHSGSDCTPIFAFCGIDFNSDESNLARRKAGRASWGDTAPPSPGSIQRTFTFSTHSDEAPGLSLLSGVSTDIQVQDGPSLVVPIALLRAAGSDALSDAALNPTSEPQSRSPVTLEHKQIARCLDAGAMDVLLTPLDGARIQGLVVHAYRTRRNAQKEMSRFLARKKLRKLSWVGMHEEEPYGYLREAMVSKLMKGICNPEEIIDEFQERDLNVTADRKALIKEQVGMWNFSAHDFSEDELVFGACQMITHAFSLPGLEHWRLTPGELQTFLLACRAAYNSFVLYHNFRHAIDVLQSVFCFLLRIGALPPYDPIGQTPVTKSSIASLISPFDALTLLISAIGHDVGHPGVNNFFLVKLNAPLAQLYNDNSVLEAFHCAAFSQILRRHWPAAFKDKQLRKLLISSILATDMGVHQKFMERMGSLQEKFYANSKSVDGWKPQDIEMYKTLLCGLLIKGADISNVARPWTVAEKWTQILQEEFANQGEMEKEVGMETALFGGPPELGNIYKLATSQIGFMSIFALPLFEGISDLLPQLQFTGDHIRRNQAQWQQYANRELRKQGLPIQERAEIAVSPRSRSPAVPVVESSESTPRATPAEDGVPPDDSDSPASSDRTESQSRGYNENNIEPVVSPDTPGPQIEITGTPIAPDITSSRKSSSAMPDLSYFSIPAAPQSARESNATQYQNPITDTTRPSGDPAVLAAALYANSATNGTASTNTEGRDYANDPSSNERPSSSRQGPQAGSTRHHAHHSSSVRTSGPSNSNRNSCTRTQSVSTYSNNMTPISPATNATSFLQVDSGDEKRVSDESAPQSDLGAPDDSSTRPSTSYASHAGDQESTYSRSPSFSKDISQSRSENGNHLPDFSHPALNGSRSPTQQSNTTGESIKNETPQGSPEDSHNGVLRRLPKRRSRLRLAFWKRRNHHQQEVHGES